MSWQLSDIEKLAKAGRIMSFKVIGKPEPVKAPKEVKTEPAGLQFIKQILTDNAIQFVTELQFAKPRRFRFDIALPALMVAVEYEGLVATGKKGGHQTKKHYTSNCDKYNLAASLGWKLYRYTFLNYKNFENDLKEMLK